MPHHLFSNAQSANLTQSEAHTGRYSMVLPDQGSYTITAPLSDAPPPPDPDDIPYTLKEKDCLGGFAPQTYEVTNLDFQHPTPQTALEVDEITPVDKEYVFSFWIKETNPTAAPLLTYDNHAVSMFIGTQPLAFDATVSSEIIDDWQRFEYVFTIPGGATGELKISVTNLPQTSTDIMFLDDPRVHPLNSSMRSFVYDPESLRLWAELDANNHATLYEYDEQGQLVRTKRETFRGIVTLAENRNNTVKKELIPNGN